ncbi:MAG TPA: isochorismatase family cysteine hydrolase [Gemmatimonadaceae bacterium]|nr:isochorismatase family cysteine hydrolase [Gemmatimonadaceae bacterium]
MPLTTLDPKTALVLIDLQKGIVARPLAHSVAGVLENARALADAFRARGLPVVLVNVAGRPSGRTEQSWGGDRPPDWADLVPELGAQPTDHLVTKYSPGAFTKTGLDSRLRGLGVTQIVLAGISTSIGVESTARQAFDDGFNVTFAVDAMTDMSLDAHNNSLRIFPRFGETGTTRQVLDRLKSQRA